MVKKKITKKATRKKPARRVTKKKPIKNNSCSMMRGVGFLKLSAMAFILFLITLIPRFNELLMGVHWGWYLAAWLIFGFFGVGSHCK